MLHHDNLKSVRQHHSESHAAKANKAMKIARCVRAMALFDALG
jgi:hypothetical protein